MAQRIVIVDDSELVLEMARDILEQAGYEVCTASNGIEANQFLFATQRPALLILDVMMPLLDGDKTLKILKGNALTKDLPVIFLSSKSESELLRLTVESGAAGFLCKPFTPEALLATVRRHVPEA